MFLITRQTFVTIVRMNEVNPAPFEGNSIFWIEVDRISPNPYQPRKSFDEANLAGLSESIRQYGVLQPLVVTRKEVSRPDGGLITEYELIAGERRLRASKLAGLAQVPVTIRSGEETNQMKLELAIIENLQREDLNAIDRAKAFQQLVAEFGYKHSEVGKSVGRSREYVSNSIRLLSLPEEMMNAVASREISEGHAKPLLMLMDKPEEQMTLFKDIILNKMTVREAEKVSRTIAFERVRKHQFSDNPDVVDVQEKLKEALGTKVQIEKRQRGGKIVIDFYTIEELRSIIDKISKDPEMANRVGDAASEHGVIDTETTNNMPVAEETKKEEDTADLYSVTDFSL